MDSLIALAENKLLSPGGIATGDLDRVFTQLMGPSIDAADLYFQHSRSESWTLEEGIVKDGSHSIEQGVGVRAISGEKTGFAYSDEIVLPQLLPIMLDMAAAKEVGTVNMVNPGPISHGEILAMYRDIVDPAFKWEEFSVEEQNKILAAERSNNTLATERLQRFAPSVLPIKDAIKKVLEEMAANNKAAAQ